MSKVSDFKLAESIIRKLCRSHNTQFVDVFVDFDGEAEDSVSLIGSKNIAHTIFKIVGEYINKSLEITGVQFLPNIQQREEFLIVLATNLRSFVYGSSQSDYIDDEAFIARLYQIPLIWILMKDFICPIYDKELENIKMVIVGSPQVDIARFYNKADIPSQSMQDESFMFVNRINNRVVQNAFIFIEALRSIGLSPIEVIKDIYETDLYDKFHGFLEVALDNDDDVNDFECTVMAIFGINFFNLISHKTAKFRDNSIKVAQNHVEGLPNQFWHVGLLEKMIEPVRGSNWDVYKGLEPYIKDFWDRVEAVKKQRIKAGKDGGVPFDTLLRIKSKQTTGYKIDPTVTIQKLLSSDRVW
jgi:hypothetical protein